MRNNPSNKWWAGPSENHILSFDFSTLKKIIDNIIVQLSMIWNIANKLYMGFILWVK